MSRWFRFYDEVLNDPKAQRLSPELFKAWVNLLCLASISDGVIRSRSDAAFALRLPETKAGAIVAELAHHGLLDAVTDGYFAPHNWALRQFKSDVTDPTNAKRQKRFRDRHANAHDIVTDTVTDTVTVTPTRADTEQNRAESEKKEPSLRSGRARGSPLPENWRPNEDGLAYARSKDLSAEQTELEIERFINHASASGRIQKNWNSAWRNWVISPLRNGTGARASPGNIPRPGSREDRNERTANALSKLTDFIAAGTDDEPGGGDAGQAPPRLLPFAKSA